MAYLFFWIAVIIGVVDWAAVAKGWRKVEYIAKPGAMIALLIFVGLNRGFGPLSDPGETMLWFALGLAFSLLGDVLLILPKEQFVGGLAAFSLAHIGYILGFNPLPPLKPPQMVVAGIVLVLVTIAWSQIYRTIARGLEHSGKPRLKLPILIYSIIISLMVLSALFTLLRGAWKPLPALAASAGAILFFISDTMLAFNKFVRPLVHGRLRYMIAYHLGQYLIILGALQHFLK